MSKLVALSHLPSSTDPRSARETSSSARARRSSAAAARAFRPSRRSRDVHPPLPRASGLRFKATAGLHHALPTGGEHGFLNLLAACVFGDEEAMLATREIALDADPSGPTDARADAETCARVRRELFASIGSCSFDEPVGELKALGIL